MDGPHSGELAYDRALEREVVVNRPYERGGSDGRRDFESFLQTARIRGQLRHTNLIPIYDHGVTGDGVPFFTEPHIRGTTLVAFLEGDRLDDRLEGVTFIRLVNYLLDTCKAVMCLHAKQYVHLQLCPRNVLVVPASREVFLVRGHPSLAPVFIDPAVAGVRDLVLAYMAPEQMDLEGPTTFDVCPDVYGLGGILFWILYGEPPNEGRSHDEIWAALGARRGHPTRGILTARAGHCRALASELEAICLRALHYDRTARYPSVLALVSDIERCCGSLRGD